MVHAKYTLPSRNCCGLLMVGVEGSKLYERLECVCVCMRTDGPFRDAKVIAGTFAPIRFPHHCIHIETEKKLGALCNYEQVQWLNTSSWSCANLTQPKHNPAIYGVIHEIRQFHIKYLSN